MKKIKMMMLSVLSIFSLAAIMNTTAFASTTIDSSSSTANASDNSQANDEASLKRVLPRKMRGKDFAHGSEIVLTQATKVHYIKFGWTKIGGDWSSIQSEAMVPAGTHLYGFYKGTNAVNACFYNPAAGVNISKHVFPSFVLTNYNYKVVKTYHWKYSFPYTLMTVLHMSA